MRLARVDWPHAACTGMLALARHWLCASTPESCIRCVRFLQVRVQRRLHLQPDAVYGQQGPAAGPGGPLHAGDYGTPSGRVGPFCTRLAGTCQSHLRCWPSARCRVDTTQPMSCWSSPGTPVRPPGAAAPAVYIPKPSCRALLLLPPNHDACARPAEDALLTLFVTCSWCGRAHPAWAAVPASWTACPRAPARPSCASS